MQELSNHDDLLYDGLAPARGIFLAFLASVVIWTLIAWACWWG